MSFDIVETTLSAAVATNGTFTVGYPTGKGAGDYALSHKHKMAALQTIYVAPVDFTVAFTTVITVTYKGTTTLPIGTQVRVQLDTALADSNAAEQQVIPESIIFPCMALIDLGCPDALDADGICASQSASGAHTLTLDGALVQAGVAILDVPRNVIVDSGGADTAVLTITGTDVFGATVVEALTLNGATAVAGKKAFKTITRITSSATISNGAFVGTGDVLGLPVYVGAAGQVFGDFEDGVYDSSIDGTLAVGVLTVASATTGDVRGTYDPGVACDGAVNFKLLAVLPDPTNRGVPQYAG
jgi:hypothetical protein